MDKKTFIIFGLALIHLHLFVMLISSYFMMSEIEAEPILIGIVIFTLLNDLGLGLLLFKRFQKIGMTQWALIPCFLLYLACAALVTPLATWYLQNILLETDAVTRLFNPVDSFDNSSGTTLPWTLKDKLEYSVVSIPMFYIYYFGQYLLLLIGSVNPRKLSKNRAIVYAQRLFTRRKKTHIESQLNIKEAVPLA